MKHLKTFENYISMSPEGMDQDLYFFLKEYLKDTKFEIRYTVGYGDDNVDDIHFVQDDGIDDNDKYVQIKDKETQPNYYDYYASEFNISSLEYDINNDSEDESYIELNNILKSALDEYKKSRIYQTKKYNL